MVKMQNNLIGKYLKLFIIMRTVLGLSKKREKIIKKYKELVSKITSNSDLDNMQELIDEKTKMENDLKPIREELDREKYLGSYSSFEGSPASREYPI